MVETRLIVLVTLLAAVSCGPRMEWSKFPMDGHRTGTSKVVGDNVTPALGELSDSVYVAPNGAVFTDGVTPAAASLLIGAQPGMRHLKQVVGHSTSMMKKGKPEGVLTNWAADALVIGAGKIFKKKIDVGILNSGGIRIDMPEGDVMFDDINSMFPFKNYVSLVTLKGADLRVIFEQMAAGKFEAVSGVRIEAADGKLTSVMVGGKSLDDNAIYRLATIDFLLDGGDGYSLAKNALDLDISDVRMGDCMIDYVRSLTADGKNIESSLDGRVIVR